MKKYASSAVLAVCSLPREPLPGEVHNFARRRSTMTTNTASSALTEEHLTKVSAAVTDVVGEEGLSRLIVAHIRDCYRLDAMCRIRSATSFEIILNEMHQYPKDASFCLVGLKDVFSMIPKGYEGSLRERDGLSVAIIRH
jgi:hypothetical protein